MQYFLLPSRAWHSQSLNSMFVIAMFVRRWFSGGQAWQGVRRWQEAAIWPWGNRSCNLTIAIYIYIYIQINKYINIYIYIYILCIVIYFHNFTGSWLDLGLCFSALSSIQFPRLAQKSQTQHLSRCSLTCRAFQEPVVEYLKSNITSLLRTW